MAAEVHDDLAALLNRLYTLVHLQPGAIGSEIRQPLPFGLLAVAVLQTGVHVLALVRPQQRRTQLALGIATRIASLAVLLVLWRAWPGWKLFDVPAIVAPSAELGIQIGLGIAFGIVALVSAVALIWAARLLLGSPAAGQRF